MKHILCFLVVALLCAMLASAQGDVVFEASQLTWDHDDVGFVEEFRMYCQKDVPNVTIHPLHLVGTIASPDNEWLISLTPGLWYCAVTAARPSEELESVMSNEWEGTVIRFGPQNLRLVPRL